jgi:hypothetical protein
MNLRVIVLAGALAAAPVTAAFAQGAGGEVLTNQTVIQMVTAKLASDVIMAKIQSTKHNFDLTSAGIIGLHTNKVPKNVIKAMLAAPGSTQKEVLTNQDVIQLVTAKVPNDVIMVKIQSGKTNFDTTTDGLVSLNTNKVPKDIIKAMMVSGGGS